MSLANHLTNIGCSLFRGVPAGRRKPPARTRLRAERLEERNLLTVNFTYEHVHLEMNYGNGAWQPFDLSDETHDLQYDPSEARFEVGPNAVESQPAGWTFIGAGDGKPYFHLDSEESDDLVSIAISTENILPHTFDSYQPKDPRITRPGEWIKLSMLNVTGPSGTQAPGFVSNWEDAQPPQFWWMSSYDGGRTLDPVFYIEPGGHVHLNWGFSGPGDYLLTLQASAFVGGSGLPVKSQQVTLVFQVKNSLDTPVAGSDLVSAVNAASGVSAPLSVTVGADAANSSSTEFLVNESAVDQWSTSPAPENEGAAAPLSLVAATPVSTNPFLTNIGQASEAQAI
jgi:surface-anchored protein